MGDLPRLDRGSPVGTRRLADEPTERLADHGSAPELEGVTGKAFAARKEKASKFTDPGPIAELERLCTSLEAATG